jgi:hypothetical protein
VLIRHDLDVHETFASQECAEYLRLPEVRLGVSRGIFWRLWLGRQVATDEIVQPVPTVIVLAPGA